MRKNIWIFHPYGTPPDKAGLVRPYDFGKQLITKGYSPVVFSSAFLHFSGKNLITNKRLYIEDNSSKVPFVYIKTHPYKGNGLSRILNMFSFFLNIILATNKFVKEHENPDVIIASSPHLLTCIAGIFIAKHYKIPCICEIRDLWPESFVAYGIIGKKNPLLKLLYGIEKWIYKKADNLIFTMEGGKSYIALQGWDKASGGSIDINKVHHINNGVDLEIFDYNKEHYQIKDEDLHNPNTFKVVYTGSIRKVNQIGMILDAAKKLKENDKTDILFLIWGNGNEVEELRQRVQEENLTTVCLKGYVNKKFIPYITSQSDLNIVLGKNKSFYRFGISINKMFDYLAAGKPLLFTYKTGFSLIEKYNAGIELNDSSAENIAENILHFKNLQIEKYNEICKNARKAAMEYDFRKLTTSLIKIIERNI